MKMKRIRKLAIVVVLTVSLFTACLVSAQDFSMYERGRDLWLDQQYPEAFSILRAFRRGDQGRRASVDYMIGTSACRIEPKKEFGFRVLDWMLYSYPLTTQSKQVVQSECQLCEQQLIATTPQPVQISEVIAAGVIGKGKAFYWTDRETPVRNYPIRRTRKTSWKEFYSRLIQREASGSGSADRAARAARERFAHAEVVVTRSLVLASGSGHSPDTLRNIGEELEKYIDFLERRYGIRRPPYYITIYLTPTIDRLRVLAEHIHGLDVSPSTIGYAFVDDLSLIAVIPGEKIGTLLHELFHLLVRGDFGDIPQWLDEGIASLYEVSKRYGGNYLGQPNWRGKVLDNFRSDWPTVREVVTSPWFPFDEMAIKSEAPDDTTIIRQATHLAYVRYFILYLQEQGVLPRVFKAFRDQQLQPKENETMPIGQFSAANHAEQLLERSTRRRLNRLQKAFDVWLKKEL